MSVPKVLPGNPLTFDATAENANPGDIVTDPTGAVPLIGFITRDGGAGRADQVVQVFAPIGAPDTITLVETSTGSGNRTLTFTVRDGAGVVKNGGRFLLRLTDSGPMTVVLSLGTGLMQATAQDLWFFGATNSLGVARFSITGTPTNTVDWDASTISASPANEGGTVTIP